MVTRSTTVILSANVAAFVANLGRAARAADDMANRGAAAVNRHQAAFDRLAKGSAIAGGIMVGGAALATKAFADFDQAMSYVRANAEGTPAEFAKLGDSVRSVGKNFGFSAVESANGAEELAKAGLSLSEIMGGALTGSLTLAAAGGVSVAEASETAAMAMSMFKLEGKDVGHIADVLAAGANASTASVGSLSQALRQGGGIAASFGISLEDTVATLAMFDQNGLKGSDAGTALKTMLTALANPSKEAALLMEDLGIKTSDAAGKFIGMAGLQDQLKSKMSDLTQEERAKAMATIFGSDAMRAANVLYGDTKGVDTWRGKVDQAGFAAKNAGTRLDNLKGDLSKLKVELMDLAIGSGSNTGFLRPVAQGAVSALQAINALPGPVKTVGFSLAIAAGSALLMGAGLIKLLGSYRSVRDGALAARAAFIAQMTAARAAAAANIVAGSSMRMGAIATGLSMIGTRVPIIASLQGAYLRAASGATRFSRAAGIASAASAAATGTARGLLAALKAIGPWVAVAAVAAGAAALDQWAAKAAEGAHSTDGLAKSLKGLASGVQDVDGELAKMGKGAHGFAGILGDDAKDADEVLRRFSINSRRHFASINDGFTDWVGNLQSGNNPSKTFLKNARDIDDSLAKMVASGNATQAAAAFQKFRSQIDAPHRAEFDKIFVKYNAAVAQAGKRAAEAKSPTKAMADAIAGAGKKAQDAEQDIDDLAKAVKGLGSAMLGERDSARGYQAALDDATGALKENGRTLDITTDKGRKNQAALDGIAQSTTGWAESVVKSGGSMAQVSGILEDGRKRYVDMAVAMGQPRAEAEKLAKSLFGLPKGVDVPVAVPGATDAYVAVDELGRQVYRIKGTNISIPVDSPGAVQTIQLLANVKGARLNADGSVTISSSANTADTMAKLASVTGARKLANGDVVITTAALNTATTIGQINAVLNAARSKQIFIDIITRRSEVYASRLERIGGGNAIGGPAGIPSYASGGAARGYTGGGKVTGPGTRTSDSILTRLSSGLVRLSNLEHVVTADEVDKMGGHGAMYALRAAVRAGKFRVPGYASGGAAAGSNWSPDISGIMQGVSAFTYDSELDAWHKLTAAQASSAKVLRDLAAARAKLREDQRAGKPASQIIKDQNRINDLIDTQRRHTQGLASAQSAYNSIRGARRGSAASQFNTAATTRNALSKKFLADVDRIARLGYGPLARTLLEQGDDEAARMAASFASSGANVLRSATRNLTQSSALAAQRDSLLSRLSGTGASVEAQRAGNREVLALRAANGQFANQSAVNVKAIVDTNAIVDGLAKQIRVQVLPGQTVVQLDSSTLATATTQHQATQASYGTTAPGVNL